jgi:DNA-binding response OmpR family regulator
MLEEAGFNVVEAFAGWKALELAEKSPPDVLLLDWQLPDITGLDVLRALRAGKCQAPAILMTAFGSEDLAIVALRLGVRDYLQKPFGEQDLLQAIEGALVEVRLRREREILLEKLEQIAQAMEAHSKQLALARDWLVRLARLTDEWSPKSHDEAQRYIREIAKAIDGLPRA